MRIPRFRFTLAQLIAFVGIVAVFCFLLTTTYWPMTLAIAIVTPGFVLDRRQGGAGILGAMLAGILGFSGLGVAVYAYFYSKGDAAALGHTGPGAWLTYLGLGGLVWGTIFGLCTWSVLFLLGLLSHRDSPHIESRSIRDDSRDPRKTALGRE
jgi:hypothetical protein